MTTQCFLVLYTRPGSKMTRKAQSGSANLKPCSLVCFVVIAVNYKTVKSINQSSKNNYVIHFNFWSRVGLTRQQILSDLTNPPASSLLAPLSPSPPSPMAGVIISYHVFICLIPPPPTTLGSPLPMHELSVWQRGPLSPHLLPLVHIRSLSHPHPAPA